jgi:galactofuranose transport system substrate-binding protein
MKSRARIVRRVSALPGSGDNAPQDFYLTSVASDRVKECRAAADRLARTVSDKEYQIFIFEFPGSEGSSPAINRKRGFEKAIAGKANLSIIRSRTGDFTRTKGGEVMEDICKDENGGR